MATTNNPYDSVKLNSSVDYKFLALMVAQKLKNEKYKKEWKVVFLKTLFQELKPILSLDGIEKLQKTVQDLFFQKQKAEKEKAAEEKAAKESSKKTVTKSEMKKSHVKMAGKRDKFGNEIDDSDSDYSDDDY